MYRSKRMKVKYVKNERRSTEGFSKMYSLSERPSALEILLELWKKQEVSNYFYLHFRMLHDTCFGTANVVK